MSDRQHNGHAPVETGALVPPHPKRYDMATDEMLYVAQEDYDAASRVATEGQLRNLLIRKLLNMNLIKLQQTRKLLDDNLGRVDA